MTIKCKNFSLVATFLVANTIVFSQQYVVKTIPNNLFPCGAGSPWVEVFSDEFNGNTINGNNWLVHTSHNNEGGGTYHDPNNVVVSNGNLNMLVKKLDSPLKKTVDFNGNLCDKYFKYSGAWIYTYERTSWQYGKFMARVKIPGHYGVWPAFWLFNDNPEWNEIDVFEFWTHNHKKFPCINCANPYSTNSVKKKNEKDQPRIHHITVHKDWNNNGKHDGEDEREGVSYKNSDYSGAFYDFSVEWDPYKIVWKVNGNTKYTLYRYYDLYTQNGLNCESVYPGMVVLENKVFPLINMYIYFNVYAQHTYYHILEPNFNLYNNLLTGLCAGITSVLNDDVWHPDLQPDDAPDGSTLPKNMQIDWIKVYKKDYCGKDLFVSNKTYDDYEHEYLGGKNITFASLGNVILEPNTKVNSKAQERIYLKPGFHAKAGSYFRARIDPFCGNLRIGSDSVENETENLIEEETTKTDNNNILINPNPSTGIFTIESEEPINPQQIELYDVFGKRIRPIVNQNNNVLSLNLIGYSKGMYFIKIGTYSQKIIIE